MSLRKNENLYLHYLDRELRNAVSYKASEVELLRALLASFSLTPGRIFCGYSHLWESHPLLADSLNLLRDGVELGLIIPASRHCSSAEFLATRQARYSHDANRYPLYFKSKKSKELQKIQPGFPTATGATQSLERDLGALIAPARGDLTTESNLSMCILEVGLKNRGDKAITGALFEPHAVCDPGSVSFIRRMISESYTRHYMYECGADILTSIPRLGQFDQLAMSFPLYDYAIFEFMLGCCYGVPNSPDELRRLIERVIERHGSPDHTAFLMQFERLLTASLHGISVSRSNATRHAPTIGKILGDLKRRADAVGVTRTSKFSFEEFGSVLLRLERTGSGDGAPTTILDGDVSIVGRKKIVFIVATDSEWTAASEVFSAQGLELSSISSPKVAAWAVGEVNGYDLIVVRTEMGTQGAGAATLVTSDAIEVFRPAYVLMPGIAFGLKKDKQNMCDVLVATSVVDYETAKITPGSVDSRGAIYPSSPELIAKARQAGAGHSDVHYGEIVCGCKVVNDPGFRDSLANRYPNAIGGEMEGVGLASACHRENVPWIVAKAICDWGEIKTDDHQPDAARQAVKFCLNLVDLLPLARC